jgi:hypothetical protein
MKTINTIDFDVDKIIMINFRHSYHTERYRWRSEIITPKYKNFILFKWRSGLTVEPEGFYERRSSYYGEDWWSFVPEDHITNYGYMIKDISTTWGTVKIKEVWTRAHVEISLGYEKSISRSFDTDDEAKEWIKRLKNLSGKTFEIYEC